jgi:hypothetical protein
MSKTEEKQDVYTRITNKIIASLDQGVRPWMKPWNAKHAAGKITRPLRHNSQPYSGINILMLWASAMEQGIVALDLDDLQAGPRTERACPKEREGLARRLRQLHYSHRA